MQLTTTDFDVIIIGGSYAGLSAAMSLGRSLRAVLVIDGGKPCNRQTPHAHNFITHDGDRPSKIWQEAKRQVLQYESVRFHEGLVTEVQQLRRRFHVVTESGEQFSARKILFATGLFDQMPDLAGFSECWGISVLHCPYCHGYEVHSKTIGLLANGDQAFELCKLLFNWSTNLILFTHGKSMLSDEQVDKIRQHNIRIEEREIARLDHTDGKIRNIVLLDGAEISVPAIFARPAFRQHSDIPERIGCELTEVGFIKTDLFARTTVPGVYAAGDNTTMMRSIANATASGSSAGAFINKELIDEDF